MGKVQYLLDTSDHCFICLKSASSDEVQTCGGEGEANATSGVWTKQVLKVYAFRNICQYLKINVKEVCKEAMPISASNSFPVLKLSDLNGILCEDCGPLLDRFSKDYLELERIRMMLQFDIKQIYERMVAVDRIDVSMTTDEFEKILLLRQQTSLKSCFVEQLRRKTLERCSTMIDHGRPFVPLKKLKFTGGAPVVHLPAETDNAQLTLNDHHGEDEVIGYPHVPVSEIIIPLKTTLRDADQAPAENPQTSTNTSPVTVIENVFDATNDNGNIHQTGISGNSRFTCDNCDDCFAHSSDLQRHRQSAHRLTYTCKYCSKSFINSSVRNRHIRLRCTAKQNRDQEDDKRIDRNINYVTPSVGNSSLPGEAANFFECYICNKIFPLETELDRQLAHHFGERTLCHHCNHRYEGKLARQIRNKQTCHPTEDLQHHRSNDKTKGQRREGSASIEGVQSTGPNSNNCSTAEPKSDSVDSITSEVVGSNNFTSSQGQTSSLSPKSKLTASDLECDICHKLFPTRTDKDIHKRTQLEKSNQAIMLRCDLCHKYKSELEFNRCTCPVLKKVDEVIRLKIQNSAAEDNTPKDVAHAGPQLTIPDVAAPENVSPSSMETQIPIETGKKSNLDKCTVCDKTFPTNMGLKRHLTVVHKAKANYECDICQKTFRSNGTFRLHVQTIHSGRRYACKFCPKIFSRMSNRSRHMKTACPKRDHQKSSNSFLSPSIGSNSQPPGTEFQIEIGDIKLERFLHQGENEVSEPYYDTGAGMEFDMDMECDLCQEKVSDPATHKCTLFETHLKVNQMGQVEREEVIPKLPFLIVSQPQASTIPPSRFNSKSGKHKCNICSKEFPRFVSFQNHYKSVHLRVSFKCNLCGKEFCKREGYNRHHRDAHLGIRYKCDMCGKMFILKTDLLDHRKNAHFERANFAAQDRPDVSKSITEEHDKEVEETEEANLSFNINHETGQYQCGICSKEFKHRRIFLEHYKSVHLEPRFVCRACGKKFHHRSNHQRHIVSVHMGLKFNCDICNRVFSQRENLIKHKQSVHYKKKFKCPYCPKLLPSAAERSHHVRFKTCDTVSGTPPADPSLTLKK